MQTQSPNFLKRHRKVAAMGSAAVIVVGCFPSGFPAGRVVRRFRAGVICRRFVHVIAAWYRFGFG